VLTVLFFRNQLVRSCGTCSLHASVRNIRLICFHRLQTSSEASTFLGLAFFTSCSYWFKSLELQDIAAWWVDPCSIRRSEGPCLGCEKVAAVRHEFHSAGMLEFVPNALSSLPNIDMLSLIPMHALAYMDMMRSL
jgi:hypothetical protein